MIPRLNPASIRSAPKVDQGERRADIAIDLLVLHDAGAASARPAFERLAGPRSQTSAHYLVDETGTIWRLVPEDRRARQAGAALWRGRGNVQDRSIDVAVLGPGHATSRRPVPALQMAALCELCLFVLARHPIAPGDVVADSDVAPDREPDAGILFDWPGLARNGVGLWPEVADAGILDPAHDAAALAPVRADLLAVGYDVAERGGHDVPLGRVLRAAQRHWRPEAVTGLADAGTRARLAAARALMQP